MADESTGGLPSGGKEQGNNIEVITTPEGFKIHGKNETSLIRSLTSLNGTPITQLEGRMRPGTSSGAGFLGNHESLTEVLADDNDTVLGMDLTHQQLADFLHKFDNAPGEGELGQYEAIDIDGKKFAHAATRWRGIQESPFGDGTGTNSDHTIINLETGAGIGYSGLLPEMIHRYGFYEGKGTGYRLDPKRVAEVAGFTPPPPDDPIAKLVQDPNAQVEITTGEQLARVSNLDSARVDVLSGQNYRIVPKDLTALLQLSTSFARSPYDRGREEPQGQRERREHIAARVDTQGITPQAYQMGSYDYNILTETVPSDFPQFEQAVLQGIEHLQLPRGREGSTDTFAVQQFLEKALKGVSEKVDGQDSPHKAYYERLLKKLSQDPQTALQLYDAATRFERQPELITALDSNFPTLKTDVIAFYKQLDMPVTEDMTLEQLIREKGNMEQYQKTLREATRFARDIGGVRDAQTEDIGRLVSIVSAAKTDPEHQFTPDEEETMRRLKVDPELVPYALKVTARYNWSPDSVIAQIYNGSAKTERELDQLLTGLPDNVDSQAREAITALIKHQQRAYSGKIDIGDFVGKVTSRAEELRTREESHGQPPMVSESDVLNDYVGLVVPQFSEFLSHPLVKKSLAKDSYSSQGVEVSLDPAVLESIPATTEQVPGRFLEQTYRKLTIGDQSYTIDQYGITKGEPNSGGEKLSIEGGNKIRLSSRAF